MQPKTRGDGRGRWVAGFLLLLAWTAGDAAAVQAAGEVPASVREVMEAPPYAEARWGLLVTDLATGAELCGRAEEELFVPASVTKLFSVAAALDVLGADYRFRTPVYGQGLGADGTVQGDLVLVASGDPTLGGRTGPGGELLFTDSDHTYAGFAERTRLVEADPLAGLRDLARQLAALGILAVSGDVVIDDRLFDAGQSSGSGPAQVLPFAINDQVVDVMVTPGRAGEPARVEWRPASGVYRAEAEVGTVAADGAVGLTLENRDDQVLRVTGTIPEGSEPVVRIVEIGDPVAFGRRLFLEALEQAGVRVAAGREGGNPRERLPAAGGYADWRLLAEHVSPPFAENAKIILKVSHNLHASALPLLLAARSGGRSAVEGLRREGRFLAEAGLPAGGYSFAGGAGGERADRASPRAAVALLRHMARHPAAEAYRAALPVLGVDGTLAEVVEAGSPARGKVRAKTGTLVWENMLDETYLLSSKALAGYLTAASGRELAFAVFLNDVVVADRQGFSQAGKALGRLCERLVLEY